MKRLAVLLGATALLVSAPASAQTVQAGTTDWSAFPEIQKKHRQGEYGRLVEWASDILKKGECKMHGQQPDRFDFDVPYAALVEPDAKITKVLIQRMGCPELETMIGTAVVAMARRGDFKPTGLPEARWFSDAVSFGRE